MHQRLTLQQITSYNLKVLIGVAESISERGGGGGHFWDVSLKGLRISIWGYFLFLPLRGQKTLKNMFLGVVLNRVITINYNLLHK